MLVKVRRLVYEHAARQCTREEMLLNTDDVVCAEPYEHPEAGRCLLVTLRGNKGNYLIDGTLDDLAPTQPDQPAHVRT
jgi:hypothetical protein